ncbi:hypothetical protein BJX64DRAFT_287552 [Aspergillus heterothallicus]
MNAASQINEPFSEKIREDLYLFLEGSVMTFGAGRRICLGRHISFLEMKKIVPALVLRYQFDLLDPKKYTVENPWFFRQYGIEVKIKKQDEEVSVAVV